MWQHIWDEANQILFRLILQFIYEYDNERFIETGPDLPTLLQK